MCSKNEYTKSESNSQHLSIFPVTWWNCVQRTNIQNLKAIHNTLSNFSLSGHIVFKERIYKIWKQFTTRLFKFLTAPVLCSKNEYTKSESNSQQHRQRPQECYYCVQRTNIQNLKAIHNITSSARRASFIVFKERIYKIWKQFTTACNQTLKLIYCVQRTNIQNLKAIHNVPECLMTKDLIVFKERIYKIWKQFTTRQLLSDLCSLLCSKNEYTKSESNSQLVLR